MSADRLTVKFVALLTAPYVAVRLTTVCATTPLVVIAKLVLVEPAAMVTLPGTCATEILLLCKVILAPPAGAGPVSVTVPVELFPPTTVVGVLANVDRTGAFTVKVTLFVIVPYVEEITTGVLESTGVVVSVNVAEVLPAGTATVPIAGTWATDVLPLCRLIIAPPAGAAPFSVTVPVEGFPPTSVAGFTLSDDSAAAFTFKVADFVVR